MSSAVRNAPGRGIEYVAQDILFPQGVWDSDLLAWVAQTVTTGGGSAVSVTNIPHVIVDSLPASGGGLTDTELRATPVPVSGTFFQATQPVSAASLPLPTGAATLAEQQTQTTALQLIDNIVSGAGANITQLGGVNVSMNTGVRDTGTQRVTIATNDSVPVTGTFWQATQPVSATALPLPAGASTDAKQDTGNTSLASVKTNTDPLVASAAGGYVRQDSTATIAKESGGNLATIATNTPTAGQKTMAGSSPVVIASDQSAIPITGAISANSSADVIAIDDDAGYTEGQTGKNLTQTPDGRLRVALTDITTDDVRRARQIQERQQLEAIDAGNLAMHKSTYERITLMDRRGSVGRGLNR